LIHCDLHSGNILLLTNRCLIADLGLCGPAENKLADTVYGVLPYMAPELISKKQYSKASDIYSLGMLMWEIFAEHSPFHGQPHDWDLAIAIVDGKTPPMLPEIPKTFQELINRCWKKDAKERPEMEEICKIVNKEFINAYENEELILEYESKSKRIAEPSREIPKSHPTCFTSRMPFIEDIENFIINLRINTSSSLQNERDIKPDDNEKVLYDETNKSNNSNDGNYSIYHSLFYLFIQYIQYNHIKRYFL